MEDNVKTMLEEEIKKEIQDLDRMEPSDDGYQAATERLAKLYKLRIEEKQTDSDIAKQSEGKKDRWIKVVLDVAGILIPIGFYHVWMNRGFKFEETGSYTSTTFRGLFNRFRPTK